MLPKLSSNDPPTSLWQVTGSRGMHVCASILYCSGTFKDRLAWTLLSSHLSHVNDVTTASPPHSDDCHAFFFKHTLFKKNCKLSASVRY